MDAAITGEAGVPTPGAAGTVRFTTRPDMADYVWTSVVLTQRSFGAQAMGWFAVSTGIIASVTTGIEPVPIVFGLLLVTGVFCIPLVWWAVRQRRDLMLAPTDITADETGMTLVGPTHRSDQQWSVYRRVRETSRGFLLELGTGAGIVVAKHGISAADVSAFRDLLVRVGVLGAPETGLARLGPIAPIALGVGAAALLVAGAMIAAR